MAKKKKMGWDFDEADSAAESSIQKVTPRTTPKSTPKRKAGRPVKAEGEKVKVLITKDAREWARKISVMEDESMAGYISRLILADAKQKGYLKE